MRCSHEPPRRSPDNTSRAVAIVRAVSPGRAGAAGAKTVAAAERGAYVAGGSGGSRSVDACAAALGAGTEASAIGLSSLVPVIGHRPQFVASATPYVRCGNCQSRPHFIM